MPSAASSQIRPSPPPPSWAGTNLSPSRSRQKASARPAVYEGHRLVVNRANADRTHLGSVRFSNCRGAHG